MCCEYRTHPAPHYGCYGADVRLSERLPRRCQQYCHGGLHPRVVAQVSGGMGGRIQLSGSVLSGHRDRKSTRLNSSHLGISYAVFCLKKKESILAPMIAEGSLELQPQVTDDHSFA